MESRHAWKWEKDITKIKKERDDLPGTQKMVITTEKDAVRLHLLQKDLAEQNLQIAVMPVEISFLFGEAESFNNFIFDYVARQLPAFGQ